MERGPTNSPGLYGDGWREELRDGVIDFHTMEGEGVIELIPWGT